MAGLEYEVFEEDRPSYAPVYVCSAFLFMGILSLAYYRIPLWPLSAAHAGLAVWFGFLLIGITRYFKQAKLFMSNRLIVSDGKWKHTFRYAVREAPHVEIAIEEIQEVTISGDAPDESQRIFVLAKSGWDVYFLPRSTDPDELVAALKEANPRIRFIT